MAQWYMTLPQNQKFPLGVETLVDPRQMFLRAQYYSLGCVTNWCYVVRLLEGKPTDDAERDVLLRGSSRSLEYAVTSIFAKESLLQERHLMLFADING